MSVTCWAVEPEGAPEWRTGMGILYSEVCDHFLQLLTLLKVRIFTGLGLLPLQPLIHRLIGIWKFFPFGNVFLCLLQAVSSIVYRRKENAITSKIIVVWQCMRLIFSVVLCWDQNDSVHSVSKKKTRKKQITPSLALNIDNKANA